MIFATITLMATLLIPVFLVGITQAADPSNWFMSVNGVLDTDYYTLYPYETDKSLKIGFSKFGELINSETNVGLEYGAVDPFAPAAGSVVTSQVPKHMWLQGWFLNITYNHRTQGTRNIWATAMHSDGVEYGNDWIRVDYYDDWSYSYGWEDPRDPGYLIYDSDPYGYDMSYGGRKTNGTAVTAPIEVLYDGPRKFIAVCRTTVYDHPTYDSNSTNADIALVEIAITIEFNKVKKEVNLFKDVKSLLAWKEGEKMKVEFSNRGEVDLGTDATGYGSYGHFFTEGTVGEQPAEGLTTVYNSNWTLIKSEDPNATDYSGFSAAGPYPQDSGATYDVAQAINPDAGYVWYAAFWPSLNDWSIDGWDQWWHSLKAADPHYVDYRNPNEEPFIPFYIGEWDFVLWHTADSQMRTQFRGVTTYGVVDHHDADDAALVSDNVIDSEVQYYLDEEFNPWDLNDAVHKNSTRWVKFVNGPASGAIDLNPDPVQNIPWDSYSNFTERLVLYPAGILWERGTQYTLTETGVTLISSVPAGSKLKILWSSDEWYETIDETAFGPGRYEWTIIGRDAQTVDSAGAALVTASIKQKNITIGLAGGDMWDVELANQIPFVMNPFGAGGTSADYKDMIGRAALNDDWCTYWPVASSNMLGVGGPVANMLSYYANDFTDAFYGLWDYAGTAYSNKITGVTCWNRGWSGTSYNVYDSYDNPTYGYAVISTYLDINGTVIFEVYGNLGRDTYYATQWLHGDAARGINPGILQLQDAPAGLTSIILKINYADSKHPTFSIVECLGTISETKWTHTYTNIYTGVTVTEVKGGIHDP
jgi:hypothetical protein